MAIQCFIHSCACDMLGIKELPLDLRNYLDDMETYANLMGGTIQSRQVVGASLVNYMENKDLKKEIHKLKQDILNITTILMKEDMKKCSGSCKSDPELHDKDWSHEDPDEYPEGNYKGDF